MKNLPPSATAKHCSLAEAAHSLESAFDLDIEQVNSITHHILKQLRHGLTTQQPWQLPSFVTNIPSGAERGTFLAIDLGGTNCRICSVILHGDSTFDVKQTKFSIPAGIRVNSSYKPLFALIASKLGDFINSNLPQDGNGAQTHKLGFTFSFTVNQTSLAQGTLIRWDKGWDIPEAVGRDPCALLQEAIDEISLPVKVCVLANDSVGTLLTRAYTSRLAAPTLAGVIFGTGTNAAYVERRSHVTRLPITTVGSRTDGLMVINTEWGSFFDEYDQKEVFPSTTYDQKLDIESSAVGEQILEKRVSGMYLGELLRLVIVDLLEKNVLEISLGEESAVHQLGGVDSSFLSALAEEDQTMDGELTRTRTLIGTTLSARGVSLADAVLLRRAAAAIVRRSARIAGAALAAIVVQSGLLESTINPQAKSAQEPPASSATRSPKSPNFYARLRISFRRFVKSITKVLGMSRKNEVLSKLTTKDSIQVSTSGSEDEGVPIGDLLDIGVDGSLIEHYPGFEYEIRNALRDVIEVGPENERRIRIGMAKDGSGVGAALMAQAAADQQ